MVIVKQGDDRMRKANILFVCDCCGCEWYAERNETRITPPCLPFDRRMECPNCGMTTSFQRIHKRREE